MKCYICKDEGEYEVWKKYFCKNCFTNCTMYDLYEYILISQRASTSSDKEIGSFINMMFNRKCRRCGIKSNKYNSKSNINICSECRSGKCLDACFKNCHAIICWAQSNPSFNTEFVESVLNYISLKGEPTVNQVKAIKNIIQEWDI